MSDSDLMYQDIRDAHVLSRIVERRAKESELWDVPFAPIVAHQERKIKLMVRFVDGAGLAAFKADDASTPVVPRGGDLTELYFEAPLIAEKHPLTSSDLLDLASPDDRVAKRAAHDVVELAKQLRIRNMNRTKWMAWQAVQGSLTITYPDGGAIAVDYDLDGSGAANSYFTSSHLITVSTAWSNVAADIIEDVYTATKLIEDDAGVDMMNCILHINSTVWRNMKKNTGLKAELSTYQPRVITPQLNEVAEILGIAKIVVYNGYYTTGSTQTKFLPDNRALITGPYQIDGVPIVEVKDCPVARVVNGDIVVAPNPGAVSEVYINEEQISKNVRVQTSRLPVINYPNALIWMTLA